MPTSDKPVKIDMSFEDAIRFFANAQPRRGNPEPTHEDSQAEESGSTTEASPEPETSGPKTAERQ